MPSKPASERGFAAKVTKIPGKTEKDAGSLKPPTSKSESEFASPTNKRSSTMKAPTKKAAVKPRRTKKAAKTVESSTYDSEIESPIPKKPPTKKTATKCAPTQTPTKTASKIEETDSEWESTTKAALRPKKAPMKKTAQKSNSSTPEVDGKLEKRIKTPVKIWTLRNSPKSSSPTIPLLKAKKRDNKREGKDDNEEEDSIPVDWDPMDIAMWNATSSPGDKAVKVHSSSPVNFKSRSGHKRSNAVDLDLFPEVVEGSEDEESEEDRTHMRRGGVQSSSPLNASSPTTPPPTATFAPKRSREIESGHDSTPFEKPRRAPLGSRLDSFTPPKLGNDDAEKKNKFEIAEVAIVGTQEPSSPSEVSRFWSLKKPGNALTTKYPYTPPISDGFLELHNLRQEVLVNTASNGFVEFKGYTLEEIWITSMIMLLQIWKIDGNEAMREKLEREREHLMEMGRGHWFRRLK